MHFITKAVGRFGRLGWLDGSETCGRRSRMILQFRTRSRCLFRLMGRLPHGRGPGADVCNIRTRLWRAMWGRGQGLVRGVGVLCWLARRSMRNLSPAPRRVSIVNVMIVCAWFRGRHARECAACLWLRGLCFCQCAFVIVIAHAASIMSLDIVVMIRSSDC